MRYINSQQITQLLNKYPLGIRIKFDYYVKQWQKSIREDILNIPAPKRIGLVSSNVLSTNSESTSSELLQLFNLNDILSTNSQGAMIINYYSLNKNLNETCRNLLVLKLINNSERNFFFYFYQ